MVEQIKSATFTYKDKAQQTAICISKIRNGSKLIVGGEYSRLELTLHQHFNWLQKLMWKLCFGVNVEDYSEE